MQCEQVLEAVKLGEESQEIWDHLATCASCRTKCESTAFVFDRADPTDKRPPAPILDARRKWLPFVLLFTLIPIVAGLVVVVIKFRKKPEPPAEVVAAPRRPVVTPSVTPVALPAAAGPQKHHVSIDATPAATVYFDGKKQGPTPFESDLPEGKLSFELKAEGYHTVRKTVQVGGDEVKLAFNLQPRGTADNSPPEVNINDPANGLPRDKPGKKGRVLDGEVGAPPPVAEKKADPEPEPEPEKPKPRPVVTDDGDDVPLFNNSFGFLTINCTPYAKVILDGKDIGRTTPVSRYSTSPGHHKIVLKARNGEVSVEVDVRPKQVVEIDKTIE
jgi:hypothetical protein